MIRINAGLVLDTEISGLYLYNETFDGRPSYKHESLALFLWYGGWWKVDTEDWYNQDKQNPIGFIKNTINVDCPEEAEIGSWHYYTNPTSDPSITVSEG